MNNTPFLDLGDYNEFDLKAELAEEFLVADNGAKENPLDETFKIESERHVLWFNQRMEEKVVRIQYLEGMKQRQLNRLEQILKREAARIRDEYDAQTEAYKKDIVWLMNRFGQQVKDALPKLVKKGAKSRKFGSIQVGYRTIGEKLKVEDEEKLEQWALAQDDPEGKLVRFDTKVMLTEMAARYKDTGEIPPGVKKVPEREQFFYSVFGANLTDILGDEWLAGKKIQNPLEDPVPCQTEPPAPANTLDMKNSSAQNAAENPSSHIPTPTNLAEPSTDATGLNPVEPSPSSEPEDSSGSVTSNPEPATTTPTAPPPSEPAPVALEAPPL